jgi:riboflavin kinase/FMN adenylyltransferase
VTVQYYEDLLDVAQGFGPSAVTIGKFDGVHIGHRSVIDRLERAAEADGLVSTVVTFDRHPLHVIDPHRVPPALTSTAQRRELLEDAGVQAALALRFDEQLQSLPAEAFVERVLVETLSARLLFVGSDFRFGAKGLGDIELLRRMGAEHGFEVRLIDDVDLVDDVRPAGERRVSSTWIRELLSDGRVAEAARLLGREHAVRSTVAHGNERGRAMNYPTANLAAPAEGFVPADGVYAARVLHDGTLYPAAVSVGNNPTFQGVPEKQVEAHLLDVDIDLYDETIAVLFRAYVRGMVAFDSMDELAAQMQQDDRDIRTILGVAQR